jgi:uroporphyrinogen decarboxylase
MTESPYLDAVRCQNRGGRPPVWIMRQAGRYMPQYRKLREEHSLMKMFRTPELIEEVTKLPIDLLGVDAAILFSDILIILDALGVKWDVVQGRGPVLEGMTDASLHLDDVHDKLSFVAEGIGRIKESVDVPLIGFAGAPFTVASYLIEGGSSRDLKRTKVWMYRDPAGFTALLDLITNATVNYLNMQIDAGVDALQIFDSWSGHLAAGPFEAYSLAYLRQILSRIKDPNIPVTIYGKGVSFYALYLADLQPSCLSLDWQCDITQMRGMVPENVALQGNLDPYLLYGEWETIRGEVDRILEGMADDPGFVLNLGHGVLPDTPFENVKRLVAHVKQAHASQA